MLVLLPLALAGRIIEGLELVPRNFNEVVNGPNCRGPRKFSLLALPLETVESPHAILLDHGKVDVGRRAEVEHKELPH